MSEIFISHSRHDRKPVASFGAALLDDLSARGYRVFIDDQDLNAGDEWRMILYRGLAQCDAAILVLTPSALTRPWVAKEAAILSWRRALGARGGAPLVVIPVLADGVQPTDVAKAFPVHYLDESQYLDVGEITEGNAATKAASVAERFVILPTCSDAMRVWTKDLASWLQNGVPAHFLEGIADAIGMEDDGWMTDPSHLVLASALLHAKFEDIRPAVRRIVDSGAINRHEIVRSLIPLAIGAESAEAVAQALGDPPPARVVAVNTQHPLVAGLLVDRATCSHWAAKIHPAAIATESPDAIYAAFVEAIADAVSWIPEEGPMSVALDDYGLPVTVLVPWGSGRHGLPTATARHIVERLRREFPQVVVLLGWSQSAPTTEALGACALAHAEPALGPGAEARIVRRVELIRTQAGLVA